MPKNNPTAAHALLSPRQKSLFPQAIHLVLACSSIEHCPTSNDDPNSHQKLDFKNFSVVSLDVKMASSVKAF
jgi:hypothetical protein